MASLSTQAFTAPPPLLHRIEVRARPGAPDPESDAVTHEAAALGVARRPPRIEQARVYLIEAPLDEEQLRRLADEMLRDTITEEATIGAGPPSGDCLMEVHPLPGVMDADAEAIALAIEAMLGVRATVSTGRRYDFHGTDIETARLIVRRSFANPVIHALYERPWHPERFPQPAPHSARVQEVPLTGLDAEALIRLSRDAHFFLTLEEMKAIQTFYQNLGREPREIELETLAQTWSEHCVHKTLKATFRYRVGDGLNETGTTGMTTADPLPVHELARRPGHTVHEDGSVTIENLLRSTVAAATHELIRDGIDWCLSVFVDNAGVIAFDDDTAVCFKVETHNHPSALEPYGGAATGIGGCIRDIMGTGLAAKPIAATDIFCVAHPDHFQAGPQHHAQDESKSSLPTGSLHPRLVLTQVVAGVRDYGNRMGIPTLNGTVWFDDDYVGNPLVFCGCIGVMPRSAVRGEPQAGDRIVALGGRTGRDGIHGATFSSAELTDAHADEFSHAVQIGNAVTEKKVLDVILAARDHEEGCLYHAITDCGAGGFSSAIGEMAGTLGAEVNLEQAPLKYAGLSPTEIWISEAQERMVLAVPAEHVETLRKLCAEHDVEMSVLGTFSTDDRQLLLRYQDQEMGRLSMDFLHEGLPKTTRQATWTPPRRDVMTTAPEEPPTPDQALRRLLAHPNIASKHWIIRQYDHEVQGRTVVKPLVGPRSEGPGDAAIILPVTASTRGLAIGNGLATGLREDPYLMVLAAIDECVRNLVCVGADPDRIAILDNFCWPGVDDPQLLGALVRAAEACYDGAKAYRTPFISGKDSLNNQLTTEDGRTIRIPPTLLISGFGIVPDVRRAVTMDAKRARHLLLIVGQTGGAMGGSHYEMLYGGMSEHNGLPYVDLEGSPRIARSVHEAMRAGLVKSAHDCSEGGLLVAVAEMAFAGDLGLHLDLAALPAPRPQPLNVECFAETPGRYLLEVSRDDLEQIDTILRGSPYAIIGEFNDTNRLTLKGTDLNADIAELKEIWRSPLDW